MRPLMISAIVLGVFGLMGCETDEGIITCTTEAIFSTTIDVEDSDGNPIEDATATYTVDGGASSACESFGGGTYLCGVEESGALSVTIEADGTTQTVDFDIESDECHVIPQSATIVM